MHDYEGPNDYEGPRLFRPTSNDYEGPGLGQIAGTMRVPMTMRVPGYLPTCLQAVISCRHRTMRVPSLIVYSLFG